MGHWYTKDGRAMHEVKNAKGGLRATTLRDARKFGLLPSVTTILGIIAKPGLVKWQVEQGILSALTLPREEGESLDDFAKRVSEDAVEQVKDAADLGTRVHASIEDWLNKQKMTDDAEVKPYLDAFINFWEGSKAKHIWSEHILTAPDYAGTGDLLIELPEEGRVLVDIKTTKFRELKRGFECTFWPEWRYQLAAYADIIGPDVKIGNLAFAKNTPDGDPIRYEFRVYTEEEQKHALAAFHHALDLWKIINNYYPELEDAKAA